jgi:hypothetical protein
VLKQTRSARERAAARNRYMSWAAVMFTAAVGAVALAGLGTSIISLNNITPSGPRLSAEDIFGLAGLAFAAAGLFAATLTYLNQTRERLRGAARRPALVNDRRIREIRAEIKSLREITSSSVTQEGQERIKSAIREQLEALSVSETLGAIREKLKSEIVYEQFTATTDNSIDRMKREIYSLESRGNLNLSIGIVTTVIGIIMLATFVFTSNYQGLDVATIIAHFVPRISLVIFIQIFAFFFLRLYRKSLDEIKYYHNEITMVEAIKSAIIIATTSGRSESAELLINRLLALPKNEASSSSTHEKDQSGELLTKIASAIAPLLPKN